MNTNKQAGKTCRSINKQFSTSIDQIKTNKKMKMKELVINKQTKTNKETAK